jgi:hypothetical protein
MTVGGPECRSGDTPFKRRKMKKKVGKRKSKSWRKRIPRCCLCTPHRWMGNTKERFRFSTRKQMLKGTE